MRAVVLDSPSSRLRVAGISLLERLIVALHRGGAGPISVVGDTPLPRFRRLGALGVGVEAIASPPSEGEYLLADGALFAGGADVASAVAARASLVDGNGGELPLELRGGSGGDPVRARAPAFVVHDPVDLGRAEDVLWRGLGTETDGLVDRYVNRPLGRALAKVLVRTPLTPNQITILGTVVGLASAALLSRPDPVTAFLGALLFQIAAILDCVDGQIARARFEESAFGRWLDFGLDNLTHVAIFTAIAVHGAANGLGTATATALGGSAVAGVLASVVVVWRSMRLPAARRDPRAAALLDRMANRDFSVAVIGFAIVGRLDWLLWLAGTLSHLYWIGAALLQARSPRERVA